MRHIALSFLAALMLSACASGGQNTSENGSMSRTISTAAGDAAGQTRDGLAGAASAPLDDFNLRRREIPQLLADMPSPYGPEEEMTCARIAMDIIELDTVLGRDWDSGAPDARLNSEILADEAADAALDTVRNVSTGWIPFRGLLRQATGAQSHEKKYNQAFKIGAQRRAYLKGYGQALGCPPPAHPDFGALKLLEKDSKIQYK